MDDHHLAPLRAAYVTQMQRAYRVASRGIPTPEQRRAWADDADALIAAHDREVQAEALRDAAETYERESGTSNGTIPWLRARADRLDKGADRG